MKALILVGGFGTRLRPLTFTKPKPLVEFLNKPILMHQVEALVKVGVTTVILAVNYKPDSMREALAEMEEKFSIKVVCSLETEPLGTAGPLALVKELLMEDDEPFFVFNSDVTCSYPLSELLKFHKAHGREGTITVTEVKDPSKYGVVVHDEAGKIARFQEKPKEFVGNHINAGLYLFNPSIIKRIEPRPTSIEREIFPVMAAEENLYCYTLQGFWMDIGQPKDYLSGMVMKLDHEHLAGKAMASGDGFVGNVLVDDSATIGKGCVIGPDVVIGAGCVIGDGVRIQRSTLMAGAKIGDHSWVYSSIIGWDAKVGKWNRIDEHTVLGEAVTVKDGLVLNGTIVCTHKGVSASQYEPGKIIM